MSKLMGFTPASVDALRRGVLADPLTPDLKIEVLASSKKKWKYLRRLAGGDEIVKLERRA